MVWLETIVSCHDMTVLRLDTIVSCHDTNVLCRLLLFLKEAVLSYNGSIVVGKEFYKTSLVIICVGAGQTLIIYCFLTIHPYADVVAMYAYVGSTPFAVACKLVPYVASVQSYSMLAVEYERRYRAQA